MAIAEMSVMTLIGLDRDKSAILNAIQRSAAAQIRSSKSYSLSEDVALPDTESFSARISRVEKAVLLVNAAIDELPKDKRPQVVKDGFGVTKDEFFAFARAESEMEKLLSEIENAVSLRDKNKAAISAALAEIKAYEPYLKVGLPFSLFNDTDSSDVYFGLISGDKKAFVEAAAAENGYYYHTFDGEGRELPFVLVSRKRDRLAAEETLSRANFRRCPFDNALTAKENVACLEKKLTELYAEDDRLLNETAAFSDKVKDLKIYSDYLGFSKEKADVEEKFRRTEKAFLLEAYVPTDAENVVTQAVEGAAKAVFMEFAPVPRDEFAPTLNKNGKIVENFEVITNMYSSPRYGELDPNAVMSFFFAAFMGLIMADVGYGLMMIAGGFILAAKKRVGTSIYRMAKVFAFGGFFAVLFGGVFDSWLGFPLLRNLLGEGYNAFYAAHIDQITAYTSIAGIGVPAILMWCLALGTVQIAVGLILKAVKCFSRGEIAQGIFGGITWAVAMLALVVWVFGMARGITYLETYGMYVTAGAVAIGVLTAGIGEKGFGIVTKSFTSAYGIINYVSDILSYARLYGLMLSGAQIASIFTNTLAIGMLFPTGVVGVIFGVVLIIVGNVFNLAINLLGAYIHDARLQYVEFFGKFYDGEGELFTPFGNSYAHTYFKE
ncbi:MAG: hypothetical protein J5762_02930 [Clostridia bacterium]|nr:hypothetical protein [Clostridia bacterium]